MATQQAQWRREFEEWALVSIAFESDLVRREGTDIYENKMVQRGWEGYQQAAQKYSPTPEEREYLEASYALEDVYHRGDKDRPLQAMTARVLESFKKLHATRQPPRVDHLAEAKRLLRESDPSYMPIPTILKHLEALEASK